MAGLHYTARRARRARKKISGVESSRIFYAVPEFPHKVEMKALALCMVILAVFCVSSNASLGKHHTQLYIDLLFAKLTKIKDSVYLVAILAAFFTTSECGLPGPIGSRLFHACTFSCFGLQAGSRCGTNCTCIPPARPLPGVAPDRALICVEDQARVPYGYRRPSPPRGRGPRRPPQRGPPRMLLQLLRNR
ncbi:hypothetical protein V5799_003242 [Amblyomma americanum]|uniref:Uncharacterized protein n=1 Tax=Amblyomma americanum TaxID=6943 RepID=A0AAQ4D9H7_AMBAM